MYIFIVGLICHFLQTQNQFINKIHLVSHRAGFTLSRALAQQRSSGVGYEEREGPVQKKMWGPSTGAVSGMQKFAAPFVGATFCGAPVRPNMLNMPQSAAG